MKKILILSYHALPMNVISAYRANAYLKHLSKYGYHPTLLTHNWDDHNSTKVSIEKMDFGTTIRVPIPVESLKTQNLPTHKAAILWRWSKGFLDQNAISLASYRALKKYCFEILSIQDFDMVLGIFSPHHHLRLCYELHEKFQIPYVLDFRDLWDNRVIHKKYQPNFTEGIQDIITKHYWKKWLSKALFYSITSEDWGKKIAEFSSTSMKVVHNGFDPELFENQAQYGDSKTFTILHGGSLYAHQKLEIFLKRV